MADKRSVLLLKDYGHVEIRLKELLDKAGMTRNALADAIGSNFEVVNKCTAEPWVKSTPTSLRGYVMFCNAALRTSSFTGKTEPNNTRGKTSGMRQTRAFAYCFFSLVC